MESDQRATKIPRLLTPGSADSVQLGLSTFYLYIYEQVTSYLPFLIHIFRIYYSFL